MARKPRTRASKPDVGSLSRRERQVLDIIFRLERATSADVLAQLPDEITDAAVRSILRILEQKGHLKHRQTGARYVYEPTISRQQARRSALRHVLTTFFDGSAEGAMMALIEMNQSRMSPDEIERLGRMIESLEAQRDGGAEDESGAES